MRVTHRIGLTLVAASVVAMYGCGKQEQPNQAARAHRPPHRQRKRSR